MNFVRLIFYCLLFFCFGCGTLPPKQFRIFQEAQAAFDAGQFARSASLYQQLIDSGMRNGEVYYNLGNAWTKAGEPAEAAAAYFLAKRYIPNDRHLDANLRSLLSNHGGTVPFAGKPFTISLFFWQDSVGCQTKLRISITAAVLTLLAGLTGLFRRTKGMKRLFLCLVSFTLIAAVSVGDDWYRFDYLRQIIIAKKEAVPKKGNSEQYEPAFVSPIPFGTSAIILDERNGWYYLRFPNGQEGWLPKSETLRL